MNTILTLERIGESGLPWNRKPVYAVMLDDKKVGELFFHMTGYTGCNLPQPNGIPLLVGERSITTYRRMIAKLNREWARVRRAS